VWISAAVAGASNHPEVGRRVAVANVSDVARFPRRPLRIADATQIRIKTLCGRAAAAGQHVIVVMS
jgi:hypothetical protein